MQTKYTNVEVQYKGQVHTNAQCSQCGWVEQDVKTAARAANQHCKETGHRVSVEKGTVYHLLPRNNASITE